MCNFLQLLNTQLFRRKYSNLALFPPLVVEKWNFFKAEFFLMHDLICKHAIILLKMCKICIFMQFVFIIFFANDTLVSDLLHKYAKYFAEIVKIVFFQDWFPNYGIYHSLFTVFESFSQPVFEICIILRDATKVRIYSTFNLKFSGIF